MPMTESIRKARGKRQRQQLASTCLFVAALISGICVLTWIECAYLLDELSPLARAATIAGTWVVVMCAVWRTGR